MSGYLIILIILAFYIVGVFAALFLGIFIAKKSLKEGEYLVKDDLPNSSPLLSWILVIIFLGLLLSEIRLLFNRIAIWYYGDKWYYKEKEDN